MFIDGCLIYLFTIYLCVYSVYLFIYLIMWVGFKIKGSNPKISVNRLNLFKVLIVSSNSFLQGCAICSSDSSSSFSSSHSLQVVQKIQKQSIQQDWLVYSTRSIQQDRLVQSRKCTSRNVELNGNFFVRSIFVKLFQCFILFFLKSLCYAFFLWSFWTQFFTSDFLSCINFQNKQI